MGAGASAHQKNEAEAKKLFGNVDDAAGTDGALLTVVDVYDEVQRHGEALKAYWTIETIEDVLSQYDDDHDGKLTRQQFLAALNDMEDNVDHHGPASPKKKKLQKAGRRVSKELGKVKSAKAPSSSTSSGSKLPSMPRSPLRWPPQRQWTWKAPKPDEVAVVLPSAATQQATLGGSSSSGTAAGATAAIASCTASASAAPAAAFTTPVKGSSMSALEELEATEVPIEKRREDFWRRMEEETSKEPRGIWQVSMRRKNGPWDADGETGMTASIAHARSLGLTPLLIDNTKDVRVDAYWVERGEQTTADDGETIKPKAQVFEASVLLQDEKLGKRTKTLILKEARKQLVSAMRHGQTFYVRLRDKATDFTHYTDDELLPMSAVFDQRIVNDLAKYTAGTEACAQEARNNTIDNHGLYESTHPLAIVIKEGDLDYQGNFFVQPGFGVVVCTTLDKDVYRESLRNSFAMARFQPIQPQ